VRNFTVAFCVLVLVLIAHSLIALPANAQTPTVSSSPVRTSSITPSRVITATVSATLAHTPTGALTTTATITATRRITLTTTVTPTATITSTLTVTPTASATPSPSPYPTTQYPLTLDAKSLAIDTLRARRYGNGQIKITRVVSTDDAFQRVMIEYPSEGLRITGMMNIPRGAGPFPVVILNHGYFKPAEYKPGDGTSRAADNFARRGYLTIASDYRCYAGSQCGPDPLYVGYAVDVLNLIADLPSLSYADTTRVGIWGHSMGGQVTLRVLVVNDSIKVASLYGALTGDDEVHYCWLYGCKAPLVTPAPRSVDQFDQLMQNYIEGIPTPSSSSNSMNARLHDIFLRSSPSRYLRNVNAPVIIHHGEKDDIVPLEWSVELAQSLDAMGKPVSLYTYVSGEHVFAGWDWQLFMARTLAFFDEQLKPRETPITVERRILRQERVAFDASF
jgi:uncharacterized protein